jgi:hypothetical protein
MIIYVDLDEFEVEVRYCWMEEDESVGFKGYYEFEAYLTEDAEVFDMQRKKGDDITDYLTAKQIKMIDKACAKKDLEWEC